MTGLPSLQQPPGDSGCMGTAGRGPRCCADPTASPCLPSAAYGLIVRPNDFASYLLAIGICNLLLYFAFYIIMKVGGERAVWGGQRRAGPPGAPAAR